MQQTETLTWIKNTLADFPASGAVLYVRSGTTYPGPSAEDPRPGLSQEARELSKDFGSLLKGRFAGAVSAPGSTSKETASFILEGAGSSKDLLQVDSDIGDPSLYITNLDLAMRETRADSVEETRELLLTGILRERTDWATSDPRSAARKILAKLAASIQADKITVFVAPSVAIAATVGFALNMEASIGHEDCPKFLEGAVIFRDANGDVWVRMGKHSGRSVL